MIGNKPSSGFDPESLTPPLLKNGHRHIKSLALDLAGHCNLACRYCAETATQPGRRPMSHKTLEAAWSFLFPEGVSGKGFSIRLGSGEPLLAFPLMRRIEELIKARDHYGAGDSPSVFLTTNGTLMDNKIRDWLISSGWNVKISLDGPKAIHDKWRILPGGSGTYNRIAESVAILAREIPDRFSVTAVLCQGTDPGEVFDAIESMGVKRIELVPVVHKDNSILPDSGDIERYRKFVKAYAARLIENSGEDSPPSLIRFEKCVFRVMGYNLTRIPCSAGRSFAGVGSGGDLYPCFRFIGVDRYRIGHISTGFDTEAAQAFICGPGRSYDCREKCRKCWAAPLCGGSCFACNEMFGPGNGEPIPFQCAYTLANAESAVFLVNQLKERDPEHLLSFLPDSSEFF